MKRLTGFINGFIACLFLVYSFWTYILWKWVRNDEICGLEIRQKYKGDTYKNKNYRSPYYPDYSYNKIHNK